MDGSGRLFIYIYINGRAPSRRQVAAERMVCGAHEAKDEAERGEGTSFYTAVLRPSGIIGPGDKVLYDKLKLGEDNVWIQGKPNGESFLVYTDGVLEK